MAVIRFLFVMFALVVSPGHGVLKVQVNRGSITPMPIAVTDMRGETPEESQLGKDITRVIKADLQRSGLFKCIDSRAFLQSTDSVHQNINFADWRAIQAQALIVGNITSDGDSIRVDFRVFDVVLQQQLIGFSYGIEGGAWRHLAHKIADAIYKRLTNEGEYFASDIIYVAEQGPAGRRISRIAIMNQDGHNHKFLTNGRHPVMNPRMSPTSRKIAYFAFTGTRRNPSGHIYVMDVDTGEREIVGHFRGAMTFAPRFSPDGSNLIYSQTEGARTAIYVLDLDSKESKPLSRSPAIDTSPCYAPDGNRIVFSSDRSGTPHLYVMEKNGHNQQRISFGKGSYNTPVWSPKGNMIAFTKQIGGVFYLGVMRPDGSRERILTQGYFIDSPTWAPNGRVLMFMRRGPVARNGRGGLAKIFTIDLTGFFEREVPTPLGASDPCWSPLIP